jgi:YesN/AraC family two-component response regulator
MIFFILCSMDYTLSRERIHLVIRAIEETLKLHVTINDYTGNFYRFIPIPNSFHCNLGCLEVKRSTTSCELCHRFDTITIPQKLNMTKTGFIKKCHANIFEMVYPMLNGKILMGTMFLGLFTITDPMNVPHIAQIEHEEHCRTNEAFLRNQTVSFTSQQLRHLSVTAEILLKQLGQELLETNQTMQKETLSRKSRIDRYISMHFSMPIKLDDLTKYLSISPSRLSEVIRREFGMSFPELLNSHRIEHAKQLLKNSTFTIEEIADRCGFSDVSYFFKVFRKCVQTTPKRYRIMHRQMMRA